MKILTKKLTKLSASQITFHLLRHAKSLSLGLYELYPAHLRKPSPSTRLNVTPTTSTHHQPPSKNLPQSKQPEFDHFAASVSSSSWARVTRQWITIFSASLISGATTRSSSAECHRGHQRRGFPYWRKFLLDPRARARSARWSSRLSKITWRHILCMKKCNVNRLFDLDLTIRLAALHLLIFFQRLSVRKSRYLPSTRHPSIQVKKTSWYTQHITNNNRSLLTPETIKPRQWPRTQLTQAYPHTSTPSLLTASTRRRRVGGKGTLICTTD